MAATWAVVKTPTEATLSAATCTGLKDATWLGVMIDTSAVVRAFICAVVKLVRSSVAVIDII